MQLESLQLENKVLLSGVPESAWEIVDQCRDKIIEILLWTIYSKSRKQYQLLSSGELENTG